MTLKTHQYLSEIETYIPGKSKAKGEKIIKLSSNENALGCSLKAIEAYKNHANEIFRYADGSCTNLRNALAKKYEIESEKIVCGAGSDEIIALLAAGFAGVGDEIIYSEHGFLMYPISAKKVGAKAVIVKEKNLKTDVEAVLNAISSKTKIIFIANPNNPTGSYLNKEEINYLVSRLPSNVMLVLDCAYEEFVSSDDYPNAIEIAKKHENVVVTRTFSKIYGLASLRIGWCYASNYVVEILNKIRGPFNVGGPAQAAALAALQDEEFTKKSKAHNDKWLKIFFAELKNNEKIIAHPAIANFILLDFKSVEACDFVNEKLLENGVILRDMRAYKLPTCLRASIGNDAENEILLRLLQEIEVGILK
jgi:histidinol-phosphate aminotransferase